MKYRDHLPQFDGDLFLAEPDGRAARGFRQHRGELERRCNGQLARERVGVSLGVAKKGASGPQV